MPPEVRIFSSPQEVAEQAALLLTGSLQTLPEAHVALSGGSTPKLLFEHLAMVYRQSLDWSNIHFFWGDERCVPPDHEESNFRMANELLLRPLSIPPAHIHRIRGEEAPEKEAVRYAREIRKWVRNGKTVPVFDWILLGMGADGHTASIFPDQMKLFDVPESCAVAHHPETGQARITFTGRLLNRADNVVFLVTGAGKAEKVSAIIRKRDPWKDYPAAHVEPVNGKVWWLLDREAGQGL